MSNVLLEAGAMKKFLIASDIPGCREIIINGKTGFTFKKNNIMDLNNRIEKFISLTTDEYNDYIKKEPNIIRFFFDCHYMYVLQVVWLSVYRQIKRVVVH